ncbi:hypothetical protein A11A3_03929 [Alcanivorax hongdengensis A-11-3]|uniref:Transmembrane protein n=1 Tax=Alcanivorax hongdengensis A-11-3 TaxID=1177179 RepID=L0WEN7_9GAMM|nr:hypothetical protein [Alcanivorax hongdengensis]EKF75476.1 hypothetical protein A11A3_03929 [Alcanivorax hongdengensis A-11-3]
MIGQRLREILYFWWRHLPALFLVSAPFALLNQVIQMLMGPVMVINQGDLSGLNVSTALVILLMQPLAGGVLVVQLASIQGGKGRGLLACLLPAVQHYPQLMLAYLLMGVAVSLGWLALFFPALWVYARLCFAPYQILLRNRSPLDALRDAFTLSQSQQWVIVLVLVMVFCSMYLVSAALTSLCITLLGDNAGSQLLATLPAALFGTALNVAVFRFWMLAGGQSTDPSSGQ